MNQCAPLVKCPTTCLRLVKASFGDGCALLSATCWSPTALPSKPARAMLSKIEQLIKFYGLRTIPICYFSTNLILSERVPAFPFSSAMATKSKVHVLDVSSEDPASTHGATSVCLDLMRYVPTISEDGEKRKRMMVGGDQGVCERFRKAILGRAEEKKDQSLSALVCQPMDFHAQKVLLINTERFSP